MKLEGTNISEFNVDTVASHYIVSSVQNIEAFIHSVDQPQKPTDAVDRLKDSYVGLFYSG